ncbi:MAG: glycosyltransferase [Candidatus Micrarchaeaceae archaeon]
MSYAVDPVVSNVFYVMSLAPHAHRHRMKPHYEKSTKRLNSPLVSVLVPFYKEDDVSIKRTRDSLSSQTYNNFDIIYIGEPDDLKLKKQLGHLHKNERLILSDGKKKMKGRALNFGLKEAKGEMLALYDAGDYIPSTAIHDAAALMIENKYDVIQSRVVRESGNHLLLKAFEIDNYIWYKKFLPFLKEYVGAFPLSGEGLYVKKKAVQSVGGFPEVLTEDGYLSILLAEKKYNFGLLDSEVRELPPESLKVHFNQRKRWFRGYYTCLKRTLTSKMTVKEKFVFSIPFISPITVAFSLLTAIFLLVFFATFLISPHTNLSIFWMNNLFYKEYILPISVLLLIFGNAFVIFGNADALVDTEYEKKALYSLLQPIYWMFIGIIALTAPFRNTEAFGRTKR